MSAFAEHIVPLLDADLTIFPRNNLGEQLYDLRMKAKRYHGFFFLKAKEDSEGAFRMADGNFWILGRFHTDPQVDGIDISLLLGKSMASLWHRDTEDFLMSYYDLKVRGVEAVGNVSSLESPFTRVFNTKPFIVRGM